ncbi:hypothetical protein GT347_18305 [Xylophilus rhododendri]|uniref:Uncharacterized protein n=1 Tax=Xylophilus rhododendri TaxID=2697032 RepID=A0A857JAK0_9BURK|nr:hypothetical protein [Xylophilus rhododendri]QHI99758.1 hypothetical protein GT347_18305 [Xylophilus rhododendri]
MPAPPPWPARDAAGAPAAAFQPVPKPRKSDRLMPRPADVAWALAKLPEELNSVPAVLAAVGQALSARGLATSCRHLRAWIALARPDLFAEQWPGLRELFDQALATCRREPWRLEDSAGFRQLIAQCAQAHELAPNHFLATHESALAHRLIFEVAQRAPSRKEMCMLMGTQFSLRLARGREHITPHAQAISECVAAMAREGFATTDAEITVLLLRRQIRLNSRQLKDLPLAVPGIAHSDRWFHPPEDAPDKYFVFRMDDPGAWLFRGVAPIGIEGTGQPSFARHLVTTEPAGCSTARCQALLAAWAPLLERTVVALQIERFLRSGWLLDRGADRLVVNPELVCGWLRRRILAGWPPHQPPAVAPAPPPPADREPDAFDDEADIDTVPIPRYGIAHTRAVFEMLASCDAAGLAALVTDDYLGREIFDFRKISQALASHRPAVGRAAIVFILQGHTPGSIGRTLAAAQWRLENSSSEQLAINLAALRSRMPLLAFAKRCTIARWINLIDPQHWCSTGFLQHYIRTLPIDEQRAARTLDAMIRDERILLFANRDCSGVHTSTLRTHLGLMGIGVDANRLKLLLKERREQIRVVRQEFIPPAGWRTRLQQQLRVQELMCTLGLQRGGRMPSWKTYMKAFQATFCARRGQPPLRFSGICAMLGYSELALELEPRMLRGQSPKRPAEDPESPPSARRARHDGPPAAGPPDPGPRLG